MKTFTLLATIALLATGCCCKKTTCSVAVDNQMTITSAAINKDGVIADKYGKRGSNFNESGMPTYSWPIKIANAPKGTVCYALVLEDKDAVPVCGFTWIHWIATNIEKTEIKENESQTATDYIQGANSWSSAVVNNTIKSASAYGGMAPPDKTHKYELTIYALDKKLDLKPGFRYNELWWAMQGHILGKETITGTYDK